MYVQEEERLVMGEGEKVNLTTSRKDKILIKRKFQFNDY